MKFIKYSKYFLGDKKDKNIKFIHVQIYWYYKRKKNSYLERIEIF